MSDKLEMMFHKSSTFMEALKSRKPHEYPEWPIDLSSKKNLFSTSNTLTDDMCKFVSAIPSGAIVHLQNINTLKTPYIDNKNIQYAQSDTYIQFDVRSGHY